MSILNDEQLQWLWIKSCSKLIYFFVCLESAVYKFAVCRRPRKYFRGCTRDIYIPCLDWWIPGVWKKLLLWTVKYLCQDRSGWKRIILCWYLLRQYLQFWWIPHWRPCKFTTKAIYRFAGWEFPDNCQLIVPNYQFLLTTVDQWYYLR